MPLPIACTVVANNYLAYARVLASSFRDLHPEGSFHVLVVDRPDPTIDYAAEPFLTTFAEKLGLPGFSHLAFRYSVLELSTALKPAFLMHLHARTGCAAATYFDPDILLLQPLDELGAMLAANDLALTPHVTAPLEDEATPGERDFLLSGAYNLGFLGVAFNQRTLPFLDWWHRRLMHSCRHAVERGLFVDQRWMDLAPSLLDRVAVLRDPGWNVAYWNLAHRWLQQRDGVWMVGDSPLRFFHFSGHMLERPELLSRHQNRFDLAERPDVEPLFADYGARLRAAGHRELGRRPYAFGAFDDGEAVPPLARQLLQDVDPGAARWPQPFATGGAGCFRDWLHGADDPGETVFLPRLAAAIWDARADLRQVFPALSGAPRAAFARWLLSHPDQGVDSRLLARIACSLQSPTDGGLGGGRLESLLRRTRESLADRGLLPAESLSRQEARSLTVEAGPGPDPEGQVRVPRLGHVLHRLRADLQASFPDPFGTDRAAFALWYVTSGRSEYDLPWRLVWPVLRTLPARQRAWAVARGLRNWWRRPPLRRPPAAAPSPASASIGRLAAAPWGVNVIGRAAAPTGVGEACRGSLAALTAAGVPHVLWSLGSSAFEHHARAGAPQGAPYEVDLLHVNADTIGQVSERLPRATTARYRIGYWFWELAHFPLAFAPAFDHVHEVWAPSRFCLDAFAPLAPVPVRWVRPAVVPRLAAPRPRSELGVPPDRFLFLFAFDAHSVPERKNPRGLLAAFAKAVARSPVPLHLLLKVNHGDEAPLLLGELRQAAAGLPVSFCAAPLSRASTDAMVASCDAFVSLHRSEGFGLPLVEAMQLGRPVIATGYGGCCDFLDEQVGWVIRHSLVQLSQPHGPYPRGAVWAEPDHEHAAELMVRVATDAGARECKAEAARHRVQELYSPEAVGACMRRELERILRPAIGVTALDRTLAAPPAVQLELVGGHARGG